MRRKTHAAGINIEHTTVAEDTTDTHKFFNDRFSLFADNAMSCLISGSSISHKDIVYTEPNLDAGAVFFLEDNSGVITTIHQATADGLGDDRENLHQNEATRRAALAICHLFCTNISSQSLSDVIADAKSYGYYKYCEGHAAFAGTKITLTPEDISCSFTNIGDTVIMVLDGIDFSIKQIVSPRVIFRGSNAFSPQSVQDYNRSLAEDKPVKSAQLITLDTINSGDLIIQMSDGAWEALPLASTENTTIDDEIWMEYIFDDENFQDILQAELKKNDLPSHPKSFQIAQSLINHVITQTIEQRQNYLQVMLQIEPYLENINLEQPVGEWLEELEDSETAKQLHYFLFESEHDGVCFAKDAEMVYILKWLNKMHFGDCTTINVLQVPDYGVELVRSLIEHPKNTKIILMRINEYFENLSEIESVLKQLQDECYLKREDEQQGTKLNKIKFKPTYSIQQIDSAQRMIEQYFSIENDANRFYNNAKNRVDIMRQKKILRTEKRSGQTSSGTKSNIK